MTLCLARFRVAQHLTNELERGKESEPWLQVELEPGTWLPCCPLERDSSDHFWNVTESVGFPYKNFGASFLSIKETILWVFGTSKLELLFGGSHYLCSKLLIADKCCFLLLGKFLWYCWWGFLLLNKETGTTREIPPHLSKIKRPLWCLLPRKNIKVLFWR